MNSNNINITEYFNTDVCNAASYDNYRKIASVVDGLKPSSRKCLYSIIKRNVKTPKKVSNLKSEASLDTQYLHGDQSLEGVIVSMAQDFAGSNNIPLLKREGSFGTRLVHAAAAGPYIFTCQEDYLDKLFKKSDEPILIPQEFEGDIIEPKYYVPILPLLVINGSIGLTTGFTQKILQHDVKDVIKYIENKLDGKEKNIPLIPSFNGFIGSVKPQNVNSDGSWYIIGSIKKVSGNEIEITDIPVSYSLEDYTEILDKLEEEKQIKEYKDLSDDGKFKFLVKLYRNGQGIDINDKNILDKLKLIVAVTENFTSMDENNRVVEYKSIYEIIDHYCELRLKYYDERKNWLIQDYTRQIKEAVSRYTFINGVVGGAIVIAKKTDEEIVSQLKKFDKIIKINDSYDYLLAMQMRSMTKTNLEKLRAQIFALRDELIRIEKMSNKDMWKEDIEEFKKAYLK